MTSAKQLAISLLSAWQWTRRFRQPACRFYPSCSQYAKHAIERHGLLDGFRLTAVRLCKCHPFHDGGVDEVPETVAPVSLPALSRIFMKSGLKPVFAASKGTILAQRACKKTPKRGA